jgi:hypothetical protein
VYYTIPVSPFHHVANIDIQAAGDEAEILDLHFVEDRVRGQRKSENSAHYDCRRDSQL